MCSCEDPAGRYQTPPTAENLLLGPAAPEYGSDPWVGFHSADGAAHDLVQLSSGALATRGLFWWAEEEIRLSGVGGGMKRKRDELRYLAEDEWEQAWAESCSEAQHNTPAAAAASSL